ncbi:MAG: peptide chain release factor 1 [Candidatus Sungbacteria bacterium]|nr:peptide chain release factor 1 [Candidatus Sungbacteria bacterium]
MNQEIENLRAEYTELQKRIVNPALISNLENYKETTTRFAKIEKILHEADGIERLGREIVELKELLRSPEIDIAKAAEEELPAKEWEYAKRIKVLEKTLRGGGDDEIRKVIIEIRAGAGGLEASLFAGTLFMMYKRFAEKNKWHAAILDSNESELGGYKEIVFELEGERVYEKLKHESGVHRVQRIPDTEKNGRIHTSTVSVAVLPEAENVDIEVKPEDIKIEFFRSSGPGGQNVNKVETAVRLIHIPTGVVVTCQEGRSQQKNREKAMTILKTRLVDAKRKEEEKKTSAERKAQIGTADRSEKIRTYNFPQDRITDHRINESWHNIENILEGNIDPIVEAFDGQ